MITINDLKERWFNASPEIMGISGGDSLAEFGMQHSGFTQWMPFPELPEGE